MGLGALSQATPAGHRVASCQAWTVVDGRGPAQPVSSAGWVSERGRSSPRLRARVTWSALRLRRGHVPGPGRVAPAGRFGAGGFEEQIGDAGAAPSRPQGPVPSEVPLEVPDTEQLCLHLRGLGAARGGPLTCRSWSRAGTGARPVRWQRREGQRAFPSRNLVPACRRGEPRGARPGLPPFPRPTPVPVRTDHSRSIHPSVDGHCCGEQAAMNVGGQMAARGPVFSALGLSPDVEAGPRGTCVSGVSRGMTASLLGAWVTLRVRGPCSVLTSAHAEYLGGCLLIGMRGGRGACPALLTRTHDSEAELGRQGGRCPVGAAPKAQRPSEGEQSAGCSALRPHCLPDQVHPLPRAAGPALLLGQTRRWSRLRPPATVRCVTSKHQIQ